MRGHDELVVSNDPGTLLALSDPAHVSWIVDGDEYGPVARQFVERSAGSDRKTFGFGPLGGADLDSLAGAAATADPADFGLAGGPFDPDAMYEMFRAQDAQARAEGFRGITVMADMDWLLPLAPSTGDLVAFEAGLDRVAGELDATVVCAYRRASFDDATLCGAQAVHPMVVTSDVESPQFRLVAGGPGEWRLSGEVDLCVLDTFVAAMRAVAGDGRTLHVGALEFIDVAGMRALARCARETSDGLVLAGVRPLFARAWQLAGFDEVAEVELQA